MHKIKTIKYFILETMHPYH